MLGIEMPKRNPHHDAEALKGPAGAATGASKNQAADRQGSEKEAWILATLTRFERRLCLYAFRILGDLERARDVVQETFLELCRKDRAQLEGHLAEWLFTVCKNRALDVRAKENPMQHVKTANDTGNDPLDALESRAAGRTVESDPAHIVEQEEEQGRAVQMLETLPDKQREVLYLKFQQGLSYKEISRVTGLSVGNVGFLIHTGMKTLRGKMKEAV